MDNVVEQQGSGEKVKINTSFEIKIPDDIRSKTAVITMVTSREDDNIFIFDPENRDNPDPKSVLKRGKSIAGFLEDPKVNDVVAYNVQGVLKKDPFKVGSVLHVFIFTESEGWVVLKGRGGFSVDS